MLDNAIGNPEMKAARKRQAEHPIEKTGAQLRAMMHGSPPTSWWTRKRTKGIIRWQSTKVFSMSFASIYPHYVNKVEKKGRTKDDLDKCCAG